MRRPFRVRTLRPHLRNADIAPRKSAIASRDESRAFHTVVTASPAQAYETVTVAAITGFHGNGFTYYQFSFAESGLRTRRMR